VVRGRAIGVPLLLVTALTACGQEPTLSVGDEPSATASAERDASPTAPPVAGGQGEGASAPAEQPDEEPAEQATAEPGPTQQTGAPAGGDGPDLDGDGRADSVSLVEVPGEGWSFDVRLADGRETSAPLPDDEAVREDVAVLGGVDLDADEVLVRTLRAVAGQNAVVFRLDGDGVWLARTDEGAPWELSTAGGMTGPRSYECTGGQVRTRESECREDGTTAR
jgi:hypothetical protein